MTHHTPGPWTVQPNSRTVGRGAWIHDETGNNVALACGTSDENANANAHLIAAAPELYEALEKIVIDEENRRKSLRTNSPAAQFSDKRLAAARAALAKARGEL